MRLGEALEELGVTPATLSAAEREQLDVDGFLPLPGLLDPAELAVVRRAFLELLEVRHSFSDTYDEGGQTLANLQNKAKVFDVCFSHPKVVAAVAHVSSILE
jgi:hypothetical protein